MYILLPLDSTNLDEAKLTKLDDVQIWTQLLVDGGEIVETKFEKNWENFELPSDYVVVGDDGEYVWPFMEYNIAVLVAHTQRYVEDILEAYLFKELHEIAY